MADDATVNELWHDAIVRRQVALQRYSATLQTEIIKLLDDTEADVRGQLQRALEQINGEPFSEATNTRLQVLADAIQKIRQSAWDGASDRIDSDMQDLAPAEADFLDSTLKDLSPVQLDTALPDPTQLAAIVSTHPIQGKILADWATSLAAQDTDKIMQSVRVGMTQGKPTDEIIRDVLGSGAFNGADGVTETVRRNAASVVQTSIATVANEARSQYIQANDDIFDQELFVAVLDARTTPICQSLDGNIYPVGEGPQPPLHWNCRSTRVPLLDGKALGSRPSVPVMQDELDGLSPDERSERIAEMVGQVPADVTYNDWLGRQTASFQDDVLGPTRGKLFRDGGLTLDRFVNRNGDQYTLEQLQDREPTAWRRAGLTNADI